VIGLDEELVPFDEQIGTLFASKNPLDQTVERLQLVIMKDAPTLPSYNREKEKWIDLDGRGRIYLQVIYGTEKRPITDLNFYRIKFKGQRNRMVRARVSYRITSAFRL